MEKGHLAIVLHAHLPFVRHPEYEDALEENWLYEALTDTYIPLLMVLEGLVHDGVDFRLTLSLTPTLTSMLADPLLQDRYRRRIASLVELAGKERQRTAADPGVHALACLYEERLLAIRAAYEDRYGGDIVGAFGRFQELGRVEIIASAATHGFLPLLQENPCAVRAQVRVGVAHHRSLFGVHPRGFWLPECAFAPGLDEVLTEAGVAFTLLETHGVTRAEPRPRDGVHAPVVAPSGVAFFGRDPDSGRQVWSSAEGYPGDVNYREFYRDIGYDLDLSYVGPYVHRDGIRIDTGFKYHRITGDGDHKEVYLPERAVERAAVHAEDFLAKRTRQAEALFQIMGGRKPIVVAPFDAELFGHWWYEGPTWLDLLMRKAASDQDTIRLVTLSEYLAEHPTQQVAMPTMSSWGDGGFNRVWLNGMNDWIYPELHRAAYRLEKAAGRCGACGGPERRALDQAARELLLAQASDWAFMINAGDTAEYATARTRRHVERLDRLIDQAAAGQVQESWIREVEAQDNIFPWLSCAEFT